MPEILSPQNKKTAAPISTIKLRANRELAFLQKSRTERAISELHASG